MISGRSKQANIHTHGHNKVTLVRGLLRLTSMLPSSLSHGTDNCGRKECLLIIIMQVSVAWKISETWCHCKWYEEGMQLQCLYCHTTSQLSVVCLCCLLMTENHLACKSVLVLVWISTNHIC